MVEEQERKLAVCFVCLGNICRSPTAEGVFIKMVQRGGLMDRLSIESAGTAAYHAGERADPRSRKTALARGYSLEGISRQFLSIDFARFDYVLAMDKDNLNELRRLNDKPELVVDLRLLRDFDEAAPPGSSVPDPYYGGAGGFDEVVSQCERACEGLLRHILARDLTS